MSSQLLTAPAIEPLSLNEAKAYLRVETGDDDDVVGALIAGARIHVKAQTRRALITQSWRISADVWPDDGRLTVLPAPLQALSAARHLVAIERDAFRAGDVLLFRWRANLPAKHAAIVTLPDTMVHAHDGAAVAEVALAPWWRRRLAYAFRFPGVA